MCDVPDACSNLRFDQFVFDSVLNPHAATSDDDGNIDHCLSYDCNYVDIDSINSHDISKRDLSLFHHNIRSLNKNGNNLIDYMSTINHRFDIYAFTETWFNSKSDANLVDIDDYHSEHCIRENRRGGGASLFI